MLIIDMSLKNATLYKGCEIEEVAGRLNLVTPPAEAVNVVGKNLASLVAEIAPKERDAVTLTGPMAVWVYLISFHAVVHSFKAVYYDDGRGTPLLIAKHG